MDPYETKSRIAEAFVESIFRRARYRISLLKGAAALRIGHEDFSPTFGIGIETDEPKYLVEAKYHPSVDQFTALENQRRDSSIYMRSEEHTSELQSLAYLVCRLLLEKKNHEERHQQCRGNRGQCDAHDRSRERTVNERRLRDELPGDADRRNDFVRVQTQRGRLHVIS